MSIIVFANKWDERPTRTTKKPRAERAWAAAAPNPDVAPVITQTGLNPEGEVEGDELGGRELELELG